MQRAVTPIVLVLVLGGLGGYIYYLNNKTPAPPADAKQRAFSSVEADAIDELRIAAGGETTRLAKTNDTWTIVEPLKADADSREVGSIATTLASLDIEEVVDEKPADLKLFGLDPARIDVAFKAKGQPAEQRLLLGDKTPTGDSVYAKLPGSPRVFTVQSYLEATFNKTTFALRDKAVLKVDRQKADGLELKAGATEIVLTKSGENWSLVKPVAARADYAVVEGALERLASAQMQGLAMDQEAAPSRFGFDKPTATMTIKTGSSSATLLLGKTENAVVFAKDERRPIVFTVAPTLRTDVIKEVGDFRRKDLFDFRSFTATRVEFTRGTETQVFERSKDKDGKDVWKGAGGKALDAGKIEELVAQTSGLRATAFEDATHASLKTPVLTIKAMFDKGSETVIFGRAGSDVVASRSGEPGSARLDAPAFEDVIKALDALK
jgi:hypothetical protein